jgi:hypothetical protein
MSAAGCRIRPVAQLLGTELPRRLHVGATPCFYITVKTNISARQAALGNGRAISTAVAWRRSRVFVAFDCRRIRLSMGAGPRIPERPLDRCHMTIRQRSFPMVGCDCARVA